MLMVVRVLEYVQWILRVGIGVTEITEQMQVK